LVFIKPVCETIISMDINLYLYLFSALLIFLVSVFFAMLGLGGGMLYVPILHWLGFPVGTVAIPTGLFLNGVNTLLAFARYYQSNLVDIRSGTPAAISALILAPIGAWSSQFVSFGMLLVLFSTVLSFVGIYSILKANSEHVGRRYSPVRRMALGLSAGGLAGYTGGLLGIGGGVIVAPLLMVMGLSNKKAIATTSFIVTISSLSGYLAHISYGNINFKLLAITILPVIIGSQIGAFYTIKMTNLSWLKKTYGILLILISLKLFYEAVNLI
jgi:uncharacterized protein